MKHPFVAQAGNVQGYEEFRHAMVDSGGQLLERAAAMVPAEVGSIRKVNEIGNPAQLIPDIAVSRPTVQLWRERFLALRVAGLEQDAPRPGRIPSIPESKVRAVVDATLHTKPPTASHWSVRSMAKAQGVSPMSVQRI